MFHTSEEEAGFRPFEDFCNAFAAKVWWPFRTHKSMLSQAGLLELISLLSQALNAKYCSRDHSLRIFEIWTISYLERDDEDIG